MHIFRNRPLSLACCLAALAALSVMSVDCRLKLFLLAGFLACGVILSVISAFRRRVTTRFLIGILTCAACTCVLVGSWVWFGPVSNRYLSRVGETVSAEGYVTERLSSGGNESRFTVRLTEFDGVPVHDRLLLECGYRSALSEGDRFRLTGQIRKFDRDASYDEETYYRADGLVAILTCAEYGDCTATGERVDTPMLALRRVNRRLCESLRAAVGGEEGALACALLLGNRSFLSGKTVLNFRRSGISHLLALSGLHISILIGIMEWILVRLRVPKRIRIAAIPPLAVFYLILTGAAVSTVRAVLMAAVLSLAFLSAERYDSFTALSAALFCILAVTPFAVLDLSLWLSFSAAASIIVFLPAMRSLSFGRFGQILPKRLLRLLTGLMTAIATGLFAACGTLGISVLFVGSVSLFSVPVTLLLSLPVSAALLLGLLTLLLPIPPVSFLLRLPLSAMLGLSQSASGVRNALILPTAPAEYAILILSVTATIAAAVLPLKRKRWVTVPLALSALFLTVCAAGVFLPDGATVTYLHASSGETLTVTSDRYAMLIDCTDGSATSVYPAVSALAESGCAEVDDLILTHYHSKFPHYLSRLTRRVLVRRLRLPEPNNATEEMFAERIEEEAALYGIEVRYDMDSLAVPDAGLIRNEHINGSGLEASVEVTLQVGETVFTGLSAELVGSDRWLSLYPDLENTDVLMLFSHGKTAGRTQTIRLPERVSDVLWGDETVAKLYPVVTSSPTQGEVGTPIRKFRIK